ncbi:MAG: uracil-DNA glycosylase [Candidatus Pacebacteria bacterium]|nr:uracil-DNA glycosylase [Candidatus Paceibacterota bacterium]
MDKAEALKELEDEMEDDATLPLRSEANLVFGEGNIDCDVMFIGEAPGMNEDRLKRPFVGRAGQLLDDMIRGLGWKRADVYITNIVKRRPPDNRDPLPGELSAYEPYLTKQIGIIKPKLIVTLGRFSMNYFIPEAKMTRDHGRALLVGAQAVFPVYHPAAALRSTQMMEVLRGDFKKIPDVLAGTIVPEVPPAFVPTVTADPYKKKEEKKGEGGARQPGLF